MPNPVVDKFKHIIGQKGFDYDQIDDNIFIGTNMCCQFGFDRELLSKGVRADISLEEVRIDTPTGVDYFLWLPTIDKNPPAPDKLELGVEVIDFLVKRKIKVYIHCQNGHGRAPTLFAAYLIRKGMKIDDAVSYIKSKRPTIHITNSQLKALKKFV